jgi:hypothetical protein
MYRHSKDNWATDFLKRRPDGDGPAERPGKSAARIIRSRPKWIRIKLLILFNSRFGEQRMAGSISGFASVAKLQNANGPGIQYLFMVRSD